MGLWIGKGAEAMSDTVSMKVLQLRDDNVICEIVVSWHDMKDWEANKVVMDIVSAVNAGVLPGRLPPSAGDPSKK